MDRYELMGWKALFPGVLWMLISVVAIWGLTGMRGPLTEGLYSILRWGPVAMFGWGVLLTAYAYYRLSQWQRGVGLICGCGGMLGPEVDGRYGLYRTCLACSRNVNRRHYS